MVVGFTILLLHSGQKVRRKIDICLDIHLTQWNTIKQFPDFTFKKMLDLFDFEIKLGEMNEISLILNYLSKMHSPSC